MSAKAKIFVMDDEELIATILTRTLKKEGYSVFTETEPVDVVDKIAAWGPDIIILDKTMPGCDGLEILKEILNRQIETQVVMLTADDSAETAVRAMKLGAVDYLTKPFNLEEVKLVVGKLVEQGDLRHELNFLRKAYAETHDEDLLGTSPAIREVREKIDKMAAARVSTILITGESGTGKEVVARRVHARMHGGGARQAPFVSVNCAAMPETLLESELFGYKKGSFTDAKTDKKGMFELAAGGTILLDEIGDMKLELQSKLLRVLENRTIRHIGGQKEIPIDATVIATTNIDLVAAVENGKFRKDLFFRLSAFHLQLPPLRARQEDIIPFVNYFFEYFAAKYNKNGTLKLAPGAERLLVNAPWPGNVRELKNLIERFVVLGSDDGLQTDEVARWVSTDSLPATPPAAERFVLPECGISLEAVEKDLLVQALEKANNNKTMAAKLLDMSYDSFRYQLKKFDLN